MYDWQQMMDETVRAVSMADNRWWTKRCGLYLWLTTVDWRNGADCIYGWQQIMDETVWTISVSNNRLETRNSVEYLYAWQDDGQADVDGHWSTFGLGPTIRSVATGHQWRGPMKSKETQSRWSAPLVSRINRSERRTDSESGLEPLDFCPARDYEITTTMQTMSVTRMEWLVSAVSRDWMRGLMAQCDGWETWTPPADNYYSPDV